MYLVSEEGCKIYTHKILLSFYSSMIGDIFKSFPADMVGISVPVSSVSLSMLIKVLTTGSVIAPEKMDLVEVSLAAEVLGVVMKDIQINLPTKSLGGKSNKEQENRNVVDVISTMVPTAEDDHIKCNMEEDLEFVIDGAPEVDYPGDGINILEVSLSQVEVADSSIKKVKRKPIKSYAIDNESTDEACKVCGISFSSKRDLTKHMNILHTEKNLRPFLCDICDKGFLHSSSLNSQKLVHTAGKSFECEFCDFAAVQKGNLKTHKLRRHKDILNTNSQVNDNETK